MSALVAKPTARLVNAGTPDPGLSAQMPVRPPSEGDGSGSRTETALKRTQRIIRQGYEEAKSRGHVSFAHLDNGAGLDISAENTQGKHVTRFILLRSNRVVKRFPVARFDGLAATSLEPPKESSVYISGYTLAFVATTARP